MARPRVFISSTYFDLRSVREELDRFVQGMGYEPVRHETGQISYGKDESPENYAYREVEFTDIVVSIVGSRFGTNAAKGDYSISQTELKRALSHGKQVYIFVDDAVYAEYRFYLANKATSGVSYTAVNDVRIYSFIEEISALPIGNPIFAFRTGADIVNTLREQWAGLVQRLLAQESAKGSTAMLERLQQGLETVDNLVRYLEETNRQQKGDIGAIVLTSHPLFADMREKLNNKYRIFFTSLTELAEWLEGARSFIMVLPAEDEVEDDFVWMKSYYLKKQKQYQTVRFKKSLFDGGGRLIPMEQGAWRDELFVVERSNVKPERFPDDDDIPF